MVTNTALVASIQKEASIWDGASDPLELTRLAARVFNPVFNPMLNPVFNPILTLF